MKDFTADVTINTKSKTAQVQLKGQLNVTNIAEIHKELSKTLKSKTIDIKIEDIEDIDVSFIQMIEALKIKCAANNILLKISSNLNEDLNLLLSRAGLQNVL